MHENSVRSIIGYIDVTATCAAVYPGGWPSPDDGFMLEITPNIDEVRVADNVTVDNLHHIRSFRVVISSGETLDALMEALGLVDLSIDPDDRDPLDQLTFLSDDIEIQIPVWSEELGVRGTRNIVYPIITGLRALGSDEWVYQCDEDAAYESVNELSEVSKQYMKDRLNKKGMDYLLREASLPEWLRGRLEAFHEAGGDGFETYSWHFELTVMELTYHIHAVLEEIRVAATRSTVPRKVKVRSVNNQALTKLLAGETLAVMAAMHERGTPEREALLAHLGSIRVLAETFESPPLLAAATGFAIAKALDPDLDLSGSPTFDVFAYRYGSHYQGL